MIRRRPVVIWLHWHPGPLRPFSPVASLKSAGSPIRASAMKAPAGTVYIGGDTMTDIEVTRIEAFRSDQIG